MKRAGILLAVILLMTGCSGAPTRENSRPQPVTRCEASSVAQPTWPKPPQVLNTGAQTAEYSYATGCYQAYMRICGKFKSESDACREDGLKICDSSAHQFAEWIGSGKHR